MNNWMVLRSRSSMGETNLENYKPASGVLIPHTTLHTTQVMRSEIKSVEVNAQPPAGILDRP